MVIVFFGTPQFAVPTLEHLLRSRHRVAGVVTQPDKRRGRGQKVVAGAVKAVALQHNVPVLQPERLREPLVAQTLAAWRPDVGVVAAYGKLIPQELLRLPPHGMVNVHASLLPKYRGAAPVHRAIIAGECETGVTIMQMVQALDAGDMLATATRAIGQDETSDGVERDLAELGAGLLVDVLERVESDTLQPEQQDEALSSYAPRLSKEEGLIDWTLPARAIHNRVRGLYPWPHAYSYLDGTRIILLKTRVVDDASGPPGRILEVTRDAVRVATGQGAVAIDEMQAEGKRAMRTRDFLAGRPIQAGATFAAP